MIVNRSRYAILFWVLVTSIFFVDCSKGPEPLFDMPIEARFTINPGLDNIQTHYFIIRNVPTFYQTYSPGNLALVDHINAGQGILSAQFDDVDWGIVREVAVHISPPFESNNNREVFYQEMINFSGVEEIRLFSSLSEVKDILLQDFVDIEVRINFRRTTFREIDARLNLNFVAYGPE